MPAAANIVINDGLATPVAHTFIPLGPDLKGVWWFEDQSSATPAGNNRISMSLTRGDPPKPGETSSNRIARVKVGIHTPKLETVSNSTVSGILPAPTVAYVERCNIELLIPERTATQDRSDMVAYIGGLMANSSFRALAISLQNLY